MEFIDFQVRAWWQREQEQAQVFVHSSPAGSMRAPLTVPFTAEQRAALDWSFTGGSYFTQQAAMPEGPSPEEAGRQLAQVILPDPVRALLTRSLDYAAGEGVGLRLRLCLDQDLVALPWELLYCDESSDNEALSGFLLLDPSVSTRLSLVREAPTKPHKAPPAGQERMVFAGSLWSGGVDAWEVKREYELLKASLKPVEEFLTLEDFVIATSDHIDQALVKPAAIFHYSGHTDQRDGEGLLIEEVRPDSRAGPECMLSRNLGTLLQRAGTRLAVFCACNSGSWVFVKPLLRAGIPAVIGIQGDVSNGMAAAFTQQLYAWLALGLTLDEAVSRVRLYLYELGRLSNVHQYEWASFMVYMPTTEPTLLPKPQDPASRERLSVALRDLAAMNPTIVLGDQTIIGSVHSNRDAYLDSTVDASQYGGTRLGDSAQVYSTPPRLSNRVQSLPGP
jgi:hypothetical protein